MVTLIFLLFYLNINKMKQQIKENEVNFFFRKKIAQVSLVTLSTKKVMKLYNSKTQHHMINRGSYTSDHFI